MCFSSKRESYCESSPRHFVKMRKVVLLMVTSVAFVIFLFSYNSSVLNSLSSDNLPFQCSLDAVNKPGVPMNDNCLLEIIRRKYLIPPSQSEYNLEQPELKNPSMGQAQLLLEILKNKTKGFFIECGALDGEVRSNTLFMERFLNWEGVLIEADPSNFKELETKNRHAWSVPACLSIKKHPAVVSFEQRKNQGRISNKKTGWLKPGIVSVQCFPVYSILLALNRTTVDYFSLDVEGSELDVLRTIPFDKVDIKTLSVEFIHNAEGKTTIKRYMEDRGYRMIQEVTHPDWLANDFIFVKETLLKS